MTQLYFEEFNYVISLDKRTWTKGHEAVLDLSQKLYAVNNPQHTSKTRNIYKVVFLACCLVTVYENKYRYFAININFDLSL